MRGDDRSEMFLHEKGQKGRHGAEPQGTSVEMSSAVEGHPLHVSCKQSPSQQEVNFQHEDSETSFLQETGAYPVG